MAQAPLPPGKPANVRVAMLTVNAQFAVITVGLTSAVLGLGLLAARGGTKASGGALALSVADTGE